MTFFCQPDCPTVQGWIDGERTEGMHTPEPWMVDPDDRPGYEWNNHIVSATDPNQTICFMTHDNTAENIEGEANARRIVACVNACNGIKTESLEMEVLSWITDETGENPLQRERDELRATLVRIATAKPANPLQFQHWAQKAAMQAFEKVDDGDPAPGEAVEQWKRENL